MKLRKANARAAARGQLPPLEEGAIIKSGGKIYRIDSIKGSKVTASVLVPWWKVLARAAAILSARIRRRFRPSRPVKRRQAPLPPEVNS